MPESVPLKRAQQKLSWNQIICYLEPVPSFSNSRGRALLYKGAGTLILLLVVLIVFFKRQASDGPIQPVFEWSTPDNPASAITNGIDRLAVMENFNGLDTLIADQCFAPVKLNPGQFQSKRQYQLTSQFMDDMSQYADTEKLKAFIGAAKQIIGATQGEVNQSALAHFSTFAGSRPILESNGDQEVLRATYQIANQRLQQLASHEQIKLVRDMTEQGLLDQLKRSGVEITLPDIKLTQPNHILRYWELTSTRYLIAQTGNPVTSQFIHSKFKVEYRPLYINAINAVIDPVQKRFESAALLAIDPGSEESGLKLRESPNGTLALMEFKGALPRAKLYSDWQDEVNAETAREILFSPGFVPQIQVVIREDNIPAPKRPAFTVKLSPVQLIALDDQQVIMKIPAVDHNTVLLLNSTYDPKWQVTVSDQSAKLLHANLDACAIYLKASATERTIVFLK